MLLKNRKGWSVQNMLHVYRGRISAVVHIVCNSNICTKTTTITKTTNRSNSSDRMTYTIYNSMKHTKTHRAETLYRAVYGLASNGNRMRVKKETKIIKYCFCCCCCMNTLFWYNWGNRILFIKTWVGKHVEIVVIIWRTCHVHWAQSLLLDGMRYSSNCFY